MRADTTFETISIGPGSLFRRMEPALTMRRSRSTPQPFSRRGVPSSAAPSPPKPHPGHLRSTDTTAHRSGQMCKVIRSGWRGGINTYAYVEGSPLSFTDPLGLAVEICSKFPPKFPHTFLCVGGNCSGKYPSGNPWSSPGQIRNDSPNKASATCSVVPDQRNDPNCFEGRCPDRC